MRLRQALVHATMFALLTGLTQLGGLAWLVALQFRRRLLVLVLAYCAIWSAAQVVAPIFGRVPLPCRGDVLRTQSLLYCAMLRNFVTPELADVAEDAARAVNAAYPGTVTLALDGGFPFLDGMPLLPHLSHDDGEKLDFAFYYADDLYGKGEYLPGQTDSPLGYFAFLRLGEETCPKEWLTLRWDITWFHPFTLFLGLEPNRTRALIVALADDPRVDRIFVEPPVAAALGVSGAKIRFQGCRAARHDDHLHIQL